MPIEPDPAFHSLLDRLETFWREQNAPVLDLALPGAHADEITSAMNEIGAEVTVEAVTLFSWHNGVEFAPRARSSNGFGFRFTTLAQGVEIFHRRRLGYEGADPALLAEADIFWDPQWMPVLEPIGGADVVGLCLAAGDDAGLVRYIARDEGWHDPARPMISLSDMVQQWLALADAGLTTWDPKEDIWTKRFPPELSARGIVV